jgi:hypothetical protein
VFKDRPDIYGGISVYVADDWDIWRKYHEKETPRPKTLKEQNTMTLFL